MEITGFEVTGLTIDNAVRFSSVPGLKIDLDYDFLFNPTTKMWRSSVGGSGALNMIATQNAAGITKTSAGITFTPGGTSIIMRAATPLVSIDNIYGGIHSGAPFGAYMVGTIDDITTGSDMFAGFDTSFKTGWRFNFVAGQKRIYWSDAAGIMNQGLPTLGAEKCWQIVQRENNISNNRTRRENNGNIGTGFLTINNPGTSVVYKSARATINDNMAIKKYLLYDWSGYTTSQVNAFDSIVRQLITARYGMAT